MIGLGFVYAVMGALFAGFAWVSLRRRRWINGGFWLLLAVSFLIGDLIGDIGNGVLVLALVGLALIGLSRQEDAVPLAGPPDRWLIPLALIVPALTLIGSLAFRWMPGLVDTKQATLVALALATLIALGIAMVHFRARLAEPFTEGLRLMDSVGWAAIMPQLLTAFGAVLAAAGVGETIGALLRPIIPADNLIGAVLVYTGGMALLTIALGNAFAAFPVMAAAVGIPLLIHDHHGNPAAVAAMGMLAGFCGTLLTPMAANFNLVPAALLGLRDRYAVIRAQAPTALMVWVAIVALLYWMAFP
jgi:uncharacterized membrane protein